MSAVHASNMTTVRALGRLFIAHNFLETLSNYLIYWEILASNTFSSSPPLPEAHEIKTMTIKTLQKRSSEVALNEIR
jgi:hypothetical protein